jgi:hypothetical protein
MGLLEDLSSGKYNLVLIAILFIFMFHQYWCTSSVARSTKESMSNVLNDIKEAVKQVYLADVEAIRNLSEVATKLQKEGLTIPGDLTVKGQITCEKKINGLTLSELKSELNNKIDSVNSSLLTNINNQISTVNSKISSNYSNLETKINEFNNEYIWGSNGGQVYRCRKPCDTGAWQQIPGGLITMSQGKKYIWGSNGGQVYRCLKPCDTGAWQQIPGGLRTLDASGGD